MFGQDALPETDEAMVALSSKGHCKADVCDVFFVIQELSRMEHLEDVSVLKGRCVLGIDRSFLFEALRKTMHPPFTPWWSRIWVVQEVAVATQIQIVYGGVSAPWSIFTSAASKYMEHSSTWCEWKLPRDEIKVLLDCCNCVLDVEGSRDGRVQRLKGNVLPAGHGKQTLLPLLRKIRDRKASDPRDKVYALLGLV
jgi:hypothetical protein